MKASKIFRAAAAAVLTASLCGCSVKFGTHSEPKSDAVVARPTGGENTEKMGVTYGEFKKEYVYYLKNQRIDDDSEESVAEKCREKRGDIIDYLINEQIILQKAREAGVLLSEEEMKAVEEAFNAQVAEQVAYYGAIADYGTLESGETVSDEERERRGNEDFDKFLSGCGITRDDLLLWATNQAIADKLIEEVGKELDYSEAERVFADYQKEVEKMYGEDIERYQQGGYYSAWAPEGARLIKHILLGFDDDTRFEISALRVEGNSGAADELRAEKAKELEDKAAEAEARIDAGDDFTKLLLEYSSDSASSSLYPNGYVVLPDGTNFPEEFKTAAFAMQSRGDRCRCVTDAGLHILIYEGEAVVEESTKKAYTDYVFIQQKQAAFSAKMLEWKSIYNYKIDYGALNLDEPSDDTDQSGAVSGE